MSNIVPFGKYKGQPMEAMQADTAYVEWLLEQDWFPTKYAKVHTLVINNFGAPSETPEHNALQALFTDDIWIASLVRTTLGNDWWNQLLQEEIKQCTEEYEQTIGKLQRELSIWEKRSQQMESHQINDNLSTRKLETTRFAIEQTETTYVGRMDWLQSGLSVRFAIRELTFEERGIDVSFVADATINSDIGFKFRFPHLSFQIECKPSLSDDYPAVLRQIRSHPKDDDDVRNVLLIGTGGYTGSGATFEQVNKIFNASGVHIVLLSRVGVLEGDVDAD